MELDIGCGFAKGYHKRRGKIAIDINRGMADIIADACHLPFRSEIFDKVLLYAILEHLDNPLSCLREVLRVSTKHARFEIEIPYDARSHIVLLKTMVLAFPLGVLRPWKAFFRWEVRWRLQRRVPTPHKNMIQPKHISHFLKLTKIELRGWEHYWFAGRKGRILKNLLFIQNPPRLSVEKVWYIEAIRKSRS